MLKILIAISGCDVYERSGFQQPMRETWLKDAKALGIDYKFFHGRGSVGTGDTILVDCDDAYFDLTSKTKLKCRWAVDHGYDFVFCAFPDTYACAERLTTCGFENFDYFGDLLYHANGYYCQGGQGYFLSKRACAYVTDHPSNYPNEDCYVGDLMRENPTMRCGDSRFFFYAGLSPTGGPLKTNKIVACHLSTDAPNGYVPKYMYEKHNLWLASQGQPQLNYPTTPEVLKPTITLPPKVPNISSPRRIPRRFFNN
jgi:hypothetical protein